MEMDTRASGAGRIFLAPLIGLLAAVEWLFPTVGLLAAPVIAAFGLRWGRPCFALSLVTAILAAALPHILFDAESAWLNGASAALAIGGGALIYYAFISAKKPYRSALAAAAVVTVAALYCRYALMDMLADEAPFSAMREAMLELSDSFADFAAQSGQTAEAEALVSVLRELADMLPDVMLSVLIAMGMGAALVGVCLCCLIARKRADIKPMARFSDWALSKSFTAGSLILTVAAMAAGFSKLTHATSLVLSLMTVALLPLAAQGVAMQAFTYRLRKRGRGLQIALWVMSAFLIPYCIFYYAIVGFIEQITRLRRRLIKPPDEGGPHEV